MNRLIAGTTLETVAQAIQKTDSQRIFDLESAVMGDLVNEWYYGEGWLFSDSALEPDLIKLNRICKRILEGTIVQKNDADTAFRILADHPELIDQYSEMIKKILESYPQLRVFFNAIKSQDASRFES